MDTLFGQHRDRLRRMVAIRWDPRLSARADPSDVVQETLAEASQKLLEYSERRTLPFYPWLRELAWRRMVTLFRHHVLAQRRSVQREKNDWTGLSDDSAIRLSEQIAADHSSPSKHLARAERENSIRSALNQLTTQDREIIVMRHLEQLQVNEIAAILGISEGAVKMRRMRAFERLRLILNSCQSEDQL
jgi:RNA polymerase sigma-70 factor (ECF subfamily)